MHQFYDFDHPARDDARVTEGEHLRDEMHNLFETFREMLAWSAFLRHRMNTLPQQCEGFLFVDEGGDVLAQLDLMMKSLEFVTPIPTGPCCALYDGAHAALEMTNNPGDYRSHRRLFTLAGYDAESLRRLMGEITTGSSLEVEVFKWLPPLA
jgi:hypothetical protein